MRTLEQRMVRLTAEVPARPFKEPLAGETYSTVHFCMSGKLAVGTPSLFDFEMNEFTPPDDDSTIIVIQLKTKVL
jgi:hypothetical protein